MQGNHRFAGLDEFIQFPAERVRDESLDVRCVASSHATETVARSQRLNLLDFTLVEKVDILIDGADEIDHQLRMLKGQHGAVLRQRLVATPEGEQRLLGWRVAKAVAAEAREAGFAGIVIMGLRFSTAIDEAYEVWQDDRVTPLYPGA